MMFKLLRGAHVTGRGDHKKTYLPGDLVTSNVNLEEKYGGDKFQRLHEAPVALSSEVEDDLDEEDEEETLETSAPKRKKVKTVEA